MDEVWDPHWFGPTKTLDVHISWLRKKIEDEPPAPLHHDGPRRRVPIRRALLPDGRCMWAHADEGQDAARRLVRLRVARRDRGADRPARHRAPRPRPFRARGADARERADDRRRPHARPARGRSRRPPDARSDTGRYAGDVGGRVVVLDDDRSRDRRLRRRKISARTSPHRGVPRSPARSPRSPSPRSAGARRRKATSRSRPHRSSTRVSWSASCGSRATSRPCRRTWGRATAAIVAVALGGLIAGLVLALAIARSLARPLSRLATTARRLGDGDLSARAGSLEGGDEVHELAGSFDEMAARV